VSRGRRVLVWAGAVAAASIGAALVVQLRNSDNPIKPGGTVSEIEFDSLTGFDCETDRWRFSAHRWHAGQAYRLIFETAQNGAFQHCLGNARFERVLRGLLLLRARHQLSNAEIQRLPKTPVLLRYSTGLGIEPFEASLSFDGSGRAVLHDGSDAFELQLTKAQFSDLEKGCDALGKDAR
jgi:hypothetical protein